MGKATTIIELIILEILALLASIPKYVVSFTPLNKPSSGYVCIGAIVFMILIKVCRIICGKDKDKFSRPYTVNELSSTSSGIKAFIYFFMCVLNFILYFMYDSSWPLAALTGAFFIICTIYCTRISY